MLGSQHQLDMLANNLANVSTTGYKRDELAFGETLVREMRAAGGDGRVLGTMSMGTASESAYTSFDPGSPLATGSPYDFAIQDSKGLFAVQTPQGVRYTRNGSFELSAEGILMTHDKHPVLDENQTPIQIPIGEMIVQPDGNIVVDGKPIAKLAVFEGQFIKAGDNMFSASTVSPYTPDSILWKSVESSNVNSVESMVEMVQLQRRFDLAQRSITQQDELTQRLIQSMNQ